ncbi:MAG TPA: hypothetical protein VI032_17125 [Burkholderiaceae bacterium]
MMMLRLSLTALLMNLLGAAPAAAQTSVGVAVEVHQPGVYGRIEVGNFPPPTVIYPQPVVIAPTPVAVYQRPVYLYIPPGHQKHWAKHCAKYAACGQPVYFVQESWVRDRYNEQQAHPTGKGKKHKGKQGHG